MQESHEPRDLHEHVAAQHAHSSASAGGDRISVCVSQVINPSFPALNPKAQLSALDPVSWTWTLASSIDPQFMKIEPQLPTLSPSFTALNPTFCEIQP